MYNSIIVIAGAADVLCLSTQTQFYDTASASHYSLQQ